MLPLRGLLGRSVRGRRRVLSGAALVLSSVVFAAAVSHPPRSVRAEDPTAGFAAQATASARLTDVTPHRYSDPVHYPLVLGAYVSCAFDNCNLSNFNRVYHGEWAQDWTGEPAADKPGAQDHPVNAPGSGQVFIKRNDETCGTASAAGTLLVIDHGGGTFSVFKHLDIAVTDGQWVHTGDQLGWMSSHGSKKCQVRYVHMEVQHGGLGGEKQPLDGLLACTNGDTYRLPQDMRPVGSDAAYSSWNDVTPYFVDGSFRERVTLMNGVSTLDGSCIPTRNDTPSAPPAPRTAFSLTSASATWTAPTDTAIDETAAMIEVYSNSLQQWQKPRYVYVAAGDSPRAVWNGLATGALHRVRIAHHNSLGWSEWSEPTTVTPGAVPSVPTVKELVGSRESIRFSWNRSTANGYPITGYRLGLRERTGGKWGRWRTSFRSNELSPYYRWDGLQPGRLYQVRVQATSAIGPSKWKVSRIATLG